MQPLGVPGRRALALLAAAFAFLAASDGRSEPLRVGASGDYAPFSLLDRAKGGSDAYTGFDAALARRLAAHLGRPLEFVPFRWPALLDDLAGGRFDVAMSGVTVRPERSVAGHFSVPVAETGAVLLVRLRILEGEDPSKWTTATLDRRGVRLAVNAGGHLERVARATFSQAHIRVIRSNDRVRQALERGQVDAVVTDTVEAPLWRQGLEDVVLVGPFTRDRKAYLLPAHEMALAGRIDAWLLARERDGTLAELRSQWLGEGAARTAEPLAALLAACDQRLSLMPFVADAKRRAGMEIVDREREDRVLVRAVAAVEAVARRIDVAAPDAGAVRAFYRAQIDAAVAVQKAELGRPEGERSRAPLDLETQIRPALLRLGDRIAWLLVELSRTPPLELDVEGALVERTRDALAARGLPNERIDSIAGALEAILAQSPPAGVAGRSLPR